MNFWQTVRTLRHMALLLIIVLSNQINQDRMSQSRRLCMGGEYLFQTALKLVSRGLDYQ